MKLATIVFLVLVLGTFSTVVAQQQQKSEKIVVDKSDIPPDLLAQIEAKNKVQTYGSWVGLGREIGVAFNEALKAMSENAAQFAQTGLGKFIMLLIAWKVVGRDLLQLLVGIPLFFIGTIFFIWLVRKNCIVRRIPLEYEPGWWIFRRVKVYEIVEPRETWYMWGYAVAYLVFLIVCSLITFV